MAPTTRMALVNVLGIFAHADTTLRAIQGLRAKGFSDLKVFTPVPVEEIEEEMETGEFDAVRGSEHLDAR